MKITQETVDGLVEAFGKEEATTLLHLQRKWINYTKKVEKKINEITLKKGYKMVATIDYVATSVEDKQ